MRQTWKQYTTTKVKNIKENDNEETRTMQGKNRGEDRIKNDKEQCEKSVIRISVNENKINLKYKE